MLFKNIQQVKINLCKIKSRKNFEIKNLIKCKESNIENEMKQ